MTTAFNNAGSEDIDTSPQKPTEQEHAATSRPESAANNSECYYCN